MTVRRSPLSAAAVGAAAVCGFVLAHAAAYFAAYPAGAVRARNMAGSGHGWLHLALPAASAAVCLLAALTGRAVARRESPRPLRREFGVLILCQSALFVVVELAERVSTGWSWSQVTASRAFVLGLALQPAVAGVVVVLRCALAVVAHHLICRPLVWRAPSLVELPYAPATKPSTRSPERSWPARGPPRTLVRRLTSIA